MHTHTHVATRPGGAWDPEATWAALALACAWLPLPCESPAQSAQGGGFCPGRGEVCAGAQEVERWVLGELSGLPVLKEGPEINAAPCPAARAAGRGFPGAGLVERSGPRTQAVLPARLYFRNQIFVLYFPSRGVLVC